MTAEEVLRHDKSLCSHVDKMFSPPYFAALLKGPSGVKRYETFSLSSISHLRPELK